MSIRIKNPKTLLLKIVLIFPPVYFVSFMFQNMAYVLPTLALGIFFGNGLDAEMSSEMDGQSSDEG